MDKSTGKIVVTGGTGLIGRSLVRLLRQNGHHVSVLTRQKKDSGDEDSFYWDPEQGYIESGALENATHIIHLAGASIGDGRWTRNRKRVIIRSRVEGARLLLREAISGETGLRAFISSSATGYYGSVTGEHVFTEADGPGEDFSSMVCTEWEHTAGLFRDMDIRTVIIRTGIVMSGDGGMLGKIISPVRTGLLPLFGSGDQYIPWIHIEDICSIYRYAIENEALEGIYNGVSPNPVTYRELIRAVAKTTGHNVFAPTTPGIIWKALFGEKASILLNGSRVSAEKLLKAGYTFKHPFLEESLASLTGVR